uniref:Uncharacterized protein n=1 Tax=Craspedostauros australis TaxID=1486917 RepID=A0A7R9WV51_9STRA
MSVSTRSAMSVGNVLEATHSIGPNENNKTDKAKNRQKMTKKCEQDAKATQSRNTKRNRERASQHQNINTHTSRPPPSLMHHHGQEVRRASTPLTKPPDAGM